MIRDFHLADWITVANGSCGIGAVFAAMSYLQAPYERWHLLLACGLIAAAMVLDVLDGKVARWRHQASPLGRELDSLSDVISFGVAPAVIAYAAGMQGGWDRVVLVYFVACGVSRLARYNVTAERMSDVEGKVRYYEGTPITTSLALVLVLAVAVWLGRLGSLMISTIRIPKP
jgi:CDP-diacylglycerol--serine O-phosphatidyltransferase